VRIALQSVLVAKMAAPCVPASRGRNSPISHILKVPPPSLNHYPYERLDSGRNEIRLLRICRPPEVDGLVSCTISHVSLDINPTYEALSYTWSDHTGDSGLVKNISLDGHFVAVTKNLEAALRRLLMNYEDRVLWVDALCINQADVAERNEQVSKMKLVYQSAKGVVAWLGEEYDQSREAFKLLQSFRKVGVQKTIYYCPEPWTREIVLPNDVVQKTHALIKLFGRNYWMRAWIIQEIAFAKRLVLYCGSDYIVWEDMISACTALQNEAIWVGEAFYGSSIGHITWLLLSSGPQLLYYTNQNIASDVTTPNKSPQDTAFIQHDVTLGGLLIRYRIKHATDPRDKVYSLLGLVPIEEQIRIPIDYNLDVYHVFRNVTTFLITEAQDLRVLAENKPPQTRSTDRNNCFDLPSWVPNWANTRQGDKLRVDRMGFWISAAGTSKLRVDRTGLWISAAGTSKPETSIRNRDILCIKGLCIGTVTNVGDLMPDFENQEFNFKPVFEALNDWWHIFLSAGRTNLTGQNGLVDILNFGGAYNDEAFPKERTEVREKEILEHLRVVLSLYKPDDTTLLPLLGKQEGVIHDDMILKAETDIWSAALICRKRKFFVVDEVECGIGPQCTEVGDLVVVVLGCNVPLVFRKRGEESGSGYFNLGDAYVDGFMGGRAIKELDAGKRSTEIFELY